jgi:hypothetical protein
VYPYADHPAELKRSDWSKPSSVEFELTKQRALLKNTKEAFKLKPLANVLAIGMSHGWSAP